jgi:transposase-like protein
MKDLKTLQVAIRWFADPKHCLEAVKQMRWPDGKIACPFCDKDRHYWLDKQMRWKCAGCRKQFSVKQGTIFEDSPLSLDKWLCAMWLIANCKNGISSYELARDIGITQKSAWFMLHRIRYAMQTGSISKMGGPESGPVEVDECFIGGTPKFMHAKRRMSLGYGIGGRTAKVPVMGMLDRDARRVRAQVVPNVKRETLQNAILKEIETGSTIYTDNASTFDTLESKQYVHDTVNHVEEYVRGQVHTQGIENFWSLLKRGLKGTYIAVEPFHLDRYVTEQVFSYNNRATKENPLNDQDRFMALLSQISGKRLTYADLTGKVTETEIPF